AEPAADLSGEAQGEAIVVRHQDRADEGIVHQSKNDLPTAVLRHGDALDVRQRGQRPVGELGAELPGEIGHGGEIGDALAVHPHPEWAPAKPGVPKLEGGVLEFSWEETEETHRRHEPQNSTLLRARVFHRACVRSVDKSVWKYGPPPTFPSLRAVR